MTPILMLGGVVFVATLLWTILRVRGPALGWLLAALCCTLPAAVLLILSAVLSLFTDGRIFMVTLWGTALTLVTLAGLGLWLSSPAERGPAWWPAAVLTVPLLLVSLAAGSDQLDRLARQRSDARQAALTVQANAGQDYRSAWHAPVGVSSAPVLLQGVPQRQAWNWPRLSPLLFSGFSTRTDGVVIDLQVTACVELPPRLLAQGGRLELHGRLEPGNGTVFVPVSAPLRPKGGSSEPAAEGRQAVECAEMTVPRAALRSWPKGQSQVTRLSGVVLEGAGERWQFSGSADSD